MNHHNRSILEKDVKSFSYTGLTLNPHALSVTHYQEKSLNKSAQCGKEPMDVNCFKNRHEEQVH